MAERDWRSDAKASLSGRDFQEVVKKFSGDPVMAAARLPLARALLGDTEHRAALSGVGYASRTICLGDGTVIRVISNSGINAISIDVPPPFPPEQQAGFGGFVFYPQTNNNLVVFNNYYQAPKLNATLSVVGGTARDHARLKIDAPIEFVPEGDNFAFLGQDVYSWVHRGTGDGPGSLYGAPFIWKNNVLYYYFSGANAIGGIVGLHPFRYEKQDGSKELRFLIGTNVGAGSVEIRAYAMRSGSMVLLAGSRVMLDSDSRSYYSDRWPVRFNSAGTECACIAKYFEDVQVQANPGAGTITIDTYKVSHEIITCSIAHTEEGIEASVSSRVAGVPHLLFMHEIYNRTAERHSNPNLVDYITNPPGSTCGSQNIDYSGSYYEETRDVITLERGWIVDHPIALNYIGNTLKVWDYKESWDLGYEYTDEYRDDGTFTCTDHFELVDGFCREVIRKLMTWAGTASRTTRFHRKNVMTIRVAGREVFRGDQSSLEITNLNGTYEMSVNGGAQGEPTPIHENPATTTAEYNRKSSDGNSAFVYRHFDVKDDVFLATTASSGNIFTWSGTNVTTSTTSGGVQFAWSGLNEVQFKIDRECVLFLHGKKVDTSPSHEEGPIEQYTNTPASILRASQEFVYPDAPTGYVITESYDTYRDPPIYELVTGEVHFSYVSDPRIKGDRLAWMYSLHYLDTKRIVEQNPLLLSKCTWGDVTPMLPAVDGDGNPTGAKVSGPTLALFPIALF